MAGIPYDKLMAFAAGELEGDEAAGMEARLRADPKARATVQRFRLAQTTVAAGTAEPVPGDVVALAKAIFTRRPASAPSGWLDRIDALVASLVFDSRLQPAAVRFGPAGGPIQMAYESDLVDVDLQAQPVGAGGESGRWALMGQVNAESDIASYRVAVVKPGESEPLATTTTDYRGMFTLELDAGVYELCVKLPERLVVLPDLKVP